MRNAGLARLQLLTVAALGILTGLGGFTMVYARGYSYLLNDPRACINCHIMNPQFDAWQSSSHKSFAVCNDCHTPHDLVGKYYIKASNGMRHSTYFTLGNFKEPIHITDGSLRVVEHNCVRCHEPLVGSIHTGSGDISCTRCHARVGHQE